ncbi:hypothetical protein ON010_g9602 [Phytophthora cinnamomi]|nr:hypothetical protein ON010_g9602 [Phytophthora cinnamomi]
MGAAIEPAWEWQHVTDLADEMLSISTGSMPPDHASSVAAVVPSVENRVEVHWNRQHAGRTTVDCLGAVDQHRQHTVHAVGAAVVGSSDGVADPVASGAMILTGSTA